MCIYGIIYDPVQPQKQARSQGVQPAPLYDNCSFGKMDSAHLGLYNMCADVILAASVLLVRIWNVDWGRTVEM